MFTLIPEQCKPELWLADLLLANADVQLSFGYLCRSTFVLQIQFLSSVLTIIRETLPNRFLE